jgi:hypothetical protein
MKLPSGFREVAFAAAALLGASATHAQQPACNADPFLAVSSWTGTVSITGTGSGTLTDSAGNVYTYNVHQTIQLGPVLTVSQTNPGNSSGPENATFNVNDTWTTTQPGFPTSTTVVTASGTTALGFFNDGAGLSISSLPLACGYSFGADETTSSYTVTVNGQSGLTTELNWGATNLPNLLVPPGTPTSPQTFVPFPTSGTTLSGSVSFNGPSWDIPSDFPISPAPLINWTVSWSFNPTPRPLDLLVTIPSYATWRPTAGANETDINVGPNNPPNLLEIKAQLVYKDTQQPTAFAPSKITFALAAVSREPGVTLNWPATLNLNPSGPPDMSFLDLSGKNNINPAYQPNADGTQAVEVPAVTDISPVFDIFLVPYDWGAWATLQVTAEVEGQASPIQGHLVSPAPPGGATVTDILLPQRQPGSSIADSWKNAHNIPLSTADTDDSENNPGGNPNYMGDGLSLYEEYRGFYVHCNSCLNGLQHVEGDPAKKDLFVINETFRPEIYAGMNRFKSGAGVNVCCKTLAMDQIRSDRVINFNHSQGAHNVDQHAVLIVNGKPGVLDACTSTKTLMPGPPGVVNQIFIPRLFDYVKYANFVQRIGLIATSPTDDVITTVAHELGHASSAWHHGETDGGDATVWWYTPDGTTINEIAKGSSLAAAQALQSSGAGTPITVFTEKERQLFPQDMGFGVGDLLPLYQGVTGGQHGGDVLCFMRYHFSLNYKAQSNPAKRYFTSEYPGAVLTGFAEGTYTNSNARSPQSRYGGATSNRGDCSNQLCLNDKVTPTPRGPASTLDCAVDELP